MVAGKPHLPTKPKLLNYRKTNLPSRLVTEKLVTRKPTLCIGLGLRIIRVVVVVVVVCVGLCVWIG